MGLIKRHPLVAFFVFAFVFTWAWWVPVALASSGVLHLPVDGLIASIAGVYGPCLAATCVTVITGGWSGLKQLFRPLFTWRVGLRWYVAAIGGRTLILIGALVLSWVIYGTVPQAPRIILSPDVSGVFNEAASGSARQVFTINPVMLIGLFVSYFFSSLGEEAGWRGYALPQLLAQRSFVRSETIRDAQLVTT